MGIYNLYIIIIYVCANVAGNQIGIFTVSKDNQYLLIYNDAIIREKTI